MLKQKQTLCLLCVFVVQKNAKTKATLCLLCAFVVQKTLKQKQ
jgi:hypothetical protein